MQIYHHSAVVKLHPQQISALDLRDVVHDELVIQQRRLNYNRITLVKPVETLYPQGTITSPNF